MLRGIYSHTKPFNKFILLLTLVLSFLLLSMLFGILALVPFYGTGILRLLASSDFSDPSLVMAMKVIQIFNTAGGILLPAAIYLWLCTPVDSKSVFYKSAAPLIFLATIILIVTAQPIVGFASELNSHLVLPKWLSFFENWMKDTEAQNGLITEAFLSTTSIGGLMINIFMIAILPAIAEETLFRGALARLFKDWTKNMHLAVFLSAFIFAAIHMQFYGFLPRFLLGTALGYLFFWSGSLWLPIVAHFTNNFLSVIVEFLYRKGYVHTNAENFGMNNAAWLTLISIIVVSVMLYYIHKLTASSDKDYHNNQPS